MRCCCNGGCLKRTFAADRADFLLDGQMWKQVYSSATCSCISPKGVVGLRISIALIWLGCVLWSIIDWVHGYGFGYWLTKLTHWSALLELVYFCFAAGTAWHAMRPQEKDGTDEATPWFVQVTWFLMTTVPTVSLLVLALYWLLVYNPVDGVTAIGVVMHGGNFLLVAFDLMFFTQPFYIAHVYVPFVFALVYVLFTLIYYAAGGTFEDGGSRYIYKSIDWSNPGGTAGLLGLIVVVGLPVVYALLYVVFGHLCCNGKGKPIRETQVAPFP